MNKKLNGLYLSAQALPNGLQDYGAAQLTHGPASRERARGAVQIRRAGPGRQWLIIPEPVRATEGRRIGRIRRCPVVFPDARENEIEEELEAPMAAEGFGAHLGPPGQRFRRGRGQAGAAPGDSPIFAFSDDAGAVKTK